MCKGREHWDAFERCFGPNRVPPEKSPTDLLVIFVAELIGTFIMIFIGCLGCTLMKIDVTEKRLMYPIMYAYGNPLGLGENVYTDLSAKMKELGTEYDKSYTALEKEIMAVIEKHFGTQLDPEVLKAILESSYKNMTRSEQLQALNQSDKDIEAIDMEYQQTKTNIFFETIGLTEDLTTPETTGTCRAKLCEQFKRRPHQSGSGGEPFVVLSPERGFKKKVLESFS